MNRRSINSVMDTIGMFAIVFSFYVVGPIQSSMVVGCICFCFVCTFKTVRKEFSKLLWSRTGQSIIMGQCLLLALSLIFPAIHGTFDLSYTKSLISQAIKIICVFFFVSCLDIKEKNISYYERLFVRIFVIQTVIQVLAFSSNSFAAIVLHFSRAGELYADYGGRRGLALSGGTGWPLAIVYALAFLFYTKNYVLSKKISLRIVFIGLMLLVGVFFSGRSAYLGILTSLLYFFLSSKRLWQKLKIVSSFLWWLVLGTALLVSILYFVAGHMLDTFLNLVLPWAFEFFYKAANTGELSTGSTDVLLDMWTKVENITFDNFLFGDGLFTDPITKKYYHEVDIGYLRNMFFWGIFGTTGLYVMFVSMFVPLYIKAQRERRLFVFILLLSFFILELKAMTVLFAHLATISIIMWLLLSERMSYRSCLEGVICYYQ